MKVIIAEKPNLGRTIASALGVYVMDIYQTEKLRSHMLLGIYWN